MRRETIKALEVRRNTVMGEARKRSTMQTLGANNEFNRNKNRHRQNTTAVVGNNLERIYSPNGSTTGASPNEGYEMSSEDERSNVARNSVRQTQPTPQPATNGPSVAAAVANWNKEAAEGRNSQL